MFDNETRSDNEEENIVFHYSHENRIKNAPKIVQDYYNGNFKLNKGIKVLFKNAPNRVLLISLVVMTAFALIYSRLSSNQNKAQLADYKMELVSFAFEEKIYTTLKISEDTKKTSSEREPVIFDVEFKVYDVNGQVFDVQNKTLLIEKSEEKLQTVVTDFDILYVEALISALGQQKLLTVDVKR